MVVCCFLLVFVTIRNFLPFAIFWRGSMFEMTACILTTGMAKNDVIKCLACENDRITQILLLTQRSERRHVLGSRHCLPLCKGCSNRGPSMKTNDQ